MVTCVGCQKTAEEAGESWGGVEVTIEFYSMPEEFSGRVCSLACAVTAMRNFATELEKLVGVAAKRVAQKATA